MKTEHTSPNQIREQRATWFNPRVRPGMTLAELFELNSEAVRFFPATEEERRQKFESLMAMPEFVL